MINIENEYYPKCDTRLNRGESRLPPINLCGRPLRGGIGRERKPPAKRIGYSEGSGRGRIRLIAVVPNLDQKHQEYATGVHAAAFVWKGRATFRPLNIDMETRIALSECLGTLTRQKIQFRIRRGCCCGRKVGTWGRCCEIRRPGRGRARPGLFMSGDWQTNPRLIGRACRRASSQCKCCHHKRDRTKKETHAVNNLQRYAREPTSTPASLLITFGVHLHISPS